MTITHGKIVASLTPKTADNSAEMNQRNVNNRLRSVEIEADSPLLTKQFS